jgi:hypothetical protein
MSRRNRRAWQRIDPSHHCRSGELDGRYLAVPHVSYGEYLNYPIRVRNDVSNTEREMLIVRA